MLAFQDRGLRLCDGMTRREWLRVGGTGAIGLALPQLLAARSAAAAPGRVDAGFGKAKACIVLFFLGGPPQHETWDPKPDAPAEIRGDLGPIPSAVPGLLVGELMPKTARLTDRLSVLRAVSSGDNAHSASGYAMTTGQPHAPLGVENARPGAPNDWPCLGGMVRRLRGTTRHGLPAAITVPEKLANDGNLTWPGQDAGFLGRGFDPWVLQCDPSQPRFQVPELALPADLPPLRVETRRGLLDQLNQRLDREVPGMDRLDRHAQQAFDLLRTTRARQAFDLECEDVRRRDRYGRTKFGQSCLLARRLVEAGVSLVQVTWSRVPGAVNNGHWDTHSRNTQGLKQLMPIMDQAYSALLEDLEQRGLLEETLVVWMAEFGRTPKINGNAGRDHWGHVFSIALAGGGVRRGYVHGASDRIAAQPKEGLVTPADFTATIFHALGYHPDTEIHDALGRPLPISRGQPVRAVFA